MKAYKQWWGRAIIAMALAFTLQSLRASNAQDMQFPATPDAQDSNAPDPPGRIARLSFMDGSVSFQPSGENDWVGAVQNRPLVTGDNLWADANSRAEVHVGSTALRLGPQTGITLLEVSDHAAQIRLVQGSLIVKVRHVDDDDSYEIDTPNVAFVVMQPGDYRLDVVADGSRTNVTVWRGRGQATGGGSSYVIVAGQHAAFSGSEQINYDLSQVPASDGFDNWASQRARDEDQSDAANYVSRDMAGYADLDAYGSWTFIPGYGPCWQPTVVAGWAPYRFGRWAWVGPWGWTWVADEPWGFAPFHYGRWAYGANGWMWVPGPKAVRPVYAPALVAWLGGGPRSNFSFSFGAGVGWLPLAPGEVFIPGYGVSRNYLNRVNTTNTAVNVTRINEVYNTVVVNRSAAANNLIYANRGVSGGVTVVSRETFVNSRAVASNVVSVPAKELASAPVSHTVAAEPVRASVTGAGKIIAIKPPVAVTTRQVVALRTPAPAPQSFGQPQTSGQFNQTALVRQQAPGRPVPLPQPSIPVSTHPSRSQESGNAIGESHPSSAPKPAARVWEAQGTPEPVQTRPATFNPEEGPAPQSTKGSRPAARPVTPTMQPVNQQQVKEPAPKPSSWQSKPPSTTSTSHAQPHAATTAPQVGSAPKK
jgi:hypothetical protein